MQHSTIRARKNESRQRATGGASGDGGRLELRSTIFIIAQSAGAVKCSRQGGAP